jgi:hypothetical protein
MRRLACASVCGVLVVAGCNGGTVDRHALTNDSATLDSIACEGALLAHDVARGRSTVYFARVQADELRIQASNFADALSRRKTIPSITKQVRQAAEHATALAATLEQLHDHPSDRTVGATVERKLETMGDCP